MKPYMSKLEAAKELSISVRTLDRMIKNGLSVKHITGTRTYRIAADDLKAFLDAHTVVSATLEVPEL